MFRSTPMLSTFGLTAVAMVVTTACNQPPPAPSVAITPEAPTTRDDLEALFDEVEDPNRSDIVNYSYAWEVLPAGAPDSEEAWEARDELSGAIVGSDQTEKGQTWRVTVTASDGVEVTASETSEPTRIENSLPEMVSVRLSPADGVDTFGTLTASGSAIDEDGDEVVLDYTWLVNGTPIEVEGNVLTGEYFDKNDVVTVEVTPNDGEAPGETVVSNAVTILNSVPRIEGVVISPEEILEETEVFCEPVGWFDPDEDPPGITATWLVNGVEVEGVTGALTGEHFGKDDLIRCMGAPDDGDDLGDMQVSEVVQVQNTAPALGSVELSSTSPKASDVLTINPIGGVDVDGDEVNYLVEWYVDGEVVARSLELPEGSFIKGQEIYAMVTPTDGVAVGEPVKSDVATAVNSPPEILEISMAPEVLYTDSAAFPSVTAVDLDGDRITYTKTWKVNGTVVGETGSVLDGDVYFDKGDTVQVELTPNDGEDDGAAVGSTVYTVQNSPPTAPEVVIDPEEPKSDDDLWCEVVTESTDADEDDLEYEITWTRNGTDFGGADTLDREGDYIDSDDTEDKDTWVCSVNVSDGTDDVTVTASVEVLDWAGPRNFTTCGQGGYLGPSQSACNSTYSGTSLDSAVTVSNGWQTWEVPQDGVYRIEARGAQGGRGRFGSNPGYNGARMRGDFTLKEGEKLRILVGQMGTNGSGSYSAGGGGASWVLKEDGTVLLAAAGGGANGYAYSGGGSFYNTSCGGQSGSRARRMSSSSSSSSCSTSYTSTGYGGTYQYRYTGSRYYYGGGGAGYRGNGTYYTSYCSSPAYAITSSSSLSGRGSNGRYADGGFGGGGCGGYAYRYSWSSFTYTSSSWGSGGGGGYTGGGGGYGRGGGGGSFNAGSSQSNTTAGNSGPGRVIVDLAP